MFIQEYVGNKDELNRKMQEYMMLGYDVKGSSPTSAILKKKKYSLALFIILLIFFVVIGLIYYFMAEEYTVSIEINPEHAGETTPMIPDPEIMPPSSFARNKNNFAGNPTSDNEVNKEYTNNDVTMDVQPVDAEVVSVEGMSCSSCGAKLNPEDKFCVECGTKVE